MADAWVKEFPVAITVADTEGKILAMNDKSVKTFEKYGGAKLVGENLLNVHPAGACAKIQDIMETKQVNAYTIEKNGVKKLIYQTPWYQDGEFAGLVELSLELPPTLPHFVRK